MKLNKEDANQYLNDILSNIQQTLQVKAMEYVRNEDYMHNFNQGAKMKDCLREEIIEAFRLKHTISRNDIIEDLKAGKELNSRVILEKYGDIINYYILETMSLLQRCDNQEKDL